MIYLNVILTVIAIVLILMFLSNGVFNILGRKEHDELRKYQVAVNNESLELHREMLKELKRGKL
jgi:hypothetical protein